MSLHSTITHTALWLRSRLREANQAGHFHARIEISGRCQDGDIKIEYGIASSEYFGTSAVTGNDLVEVVTEYLRRNGWKEAHAPLCIGHAESSEED